MITTTKKTINNQTVTLVSVETNNLIFSCMSLGATILDLQSKDKDDNFESVIMQYQELEAYDHNELCLNQLVGPTPGRLPAKTYLFDDKLVELDGNDGNAHLHGSKYNLAYHNFEVSVTENDGVHIHFKATIDRLSYYPGIQTYHIVYTIKDNTLTIDFKGSTDTMTFMNLTQHAYFNLSGNIKDDIQNHYLTITADTHLELNNDFIPYKKATVNNTHLDFRHGKQLKTHMTKDILQRPEKGLDNPLIFGNQKEIILYEPTSHRQLTVTTTYPCVVVYSDNHNKNYAFQHMTKRKMHMGICFETQRPPNGIHIEDIDSGLLNKEDYYHYQTTYHFDVVENTDD